MEKSVTLLLIKKNKVLLQKRDDKPYILMPGYWAFPGGTVEYKENIKDAICREIKEETGYKIKKPILFNQKLVQLPSMKKIFMCFFYDIYDGKQKIKCFEGKKMEFKSFRKTLKLKLPPTHREALKKYLKNPILLHHRLSYK